MANRCVRHFLSHNYAITYVCNARFKQAPEHDCDMDTYDAEVSE